MELVEKMFHVKQLQILGLLGEGGGCAPSPLGRGLGVGRVAVRGCGIPICPAAGGNSLAGITAGAEE